MTLGPSSQADVTIVVTTHNDAHFLDDALGSVLDQTRSPAEVILIDDGSNDDLSFITTNYPHIKLIRTEHQGLAAARNRGLELATSPYIVFWMLMMCWPLPGWKPAYHAWRPIRAPALFMALII